MIEARDSFVTLGGYIVALIALAVYIHYQLKALVRQYHKQAIETDAPVSKPSKSKKVKEVEQTEIVTPIRPRRATKEDDHDTVTGINKINTIILEMVLDQDFDKIDALGEAIADLSETVDKATIEKYYRKIKLT